MNSNWRSADDKILIDFVRDHEVLYNVKNKDYRQMPMKQKLWCEVGKILNKTDSDCYKRWCYVRDYYIRRKGKPGTGGEAAKKRSDLLSFLDSFSSSQRNSITKVFVVDNSAENTQDNSQQKPFEKEDMTFNNEGNNSNKNDEDNNKEFKEHDNIIKSNQKRKNNSYTPERLNLLKQIAQRNPSTQDELDENDLFFSSMAKIVKKLPRFEQAKLRMHIGSLVGNAELSHIPIDSPPISVSSGPSTSASDCSETAIPFTKTSTSDVSDYSEIAIPPSKPIIAVNYQGKVYFISQDNIKLH